MCRRDSICAFVQVGMDKTSKTILFLILMIFSKDYKALIFKAKMLENIFR